MGTLRFLLATSVVLVHAGAPVSMSGFGGANSVEVFFFISGFLIASVLTKEYSSTRIFYFNRFLRIFPTYWLVLFLTFIFYFCNLNTSAQNPIKEISQLPIGIALSSIFMNLFIFGSDILCFIKISSSGLNGIVDSSSNIVTGTQYLIISPVWTLSLELIFYIFAPFLIKYSTRSLILIIVPLILIRGTAFTFGFNDDPWNYRFFPFELPIFMLGILTFRFSQNIDKVFNNPRFFRFLSNPLILIIYFIIFGYIRSSLNIPRYLELLLLLSLSFFVVCRKYTSKTDSVLANLSFPMYIIHYPLISFFKIYGDNLNFYSPFSKSEQIILLLLMTIFVSFIMYKVVEPIEKIRKRIRALNSKSMNLTRK